MAKFNYSTTDFRILELKMKALEKGVNANDIIDTALYLFNYIDNCEDDSITISILKEVVIDKNLFEKDYKLGDKND